MSSKHERNDVAAALMNIYYFLYRIRMENKNTSEFLRQDIMSVQAGS
jgi:hypothetical protein